MNKEHLLQAIQDFDDGYNNYNQGNIFCFLYQNKWYPLRALINYASNLAGENIEYTKDRSLVKIHEHLDYVKIKRVQIDHNGLVVLGMNEKMVEVNILSRMLTELSKPH